MKNKCKECGHEQNVTTNAKRTTCSIYDAKIPLRVLIASLLVIGVVGGSTYADIAVIQENLTPQEVHFHIGTITQSKNGKIGIGLAVAGITVSLIIALLGV